MAHLHAPVRPGAAVNGRREGRALRLMIVILMPLAIATAIGMYLLWPREVSAHVQQDVSQYSVKGFTLPTAVITKVQPMSCSGQVGYIPNSTGDGQCAKLTVRVLNGPGKGDQTQVTLTQAQFASGAKVGQKVKISRIPGSAQSKASYEFSDFDRTVPLLAFAALFVLAVILVARWRGVAALIGLGFAGFILIRFIFPALVSGENPLLVALVGSSAIVFVVLYAAHGFSTRTTTALVGTLFGLLLTAGLGWVATRWGHLTGVVTEDDYLLAASAPDLKLAAVVLCGIIIAGLGVLNDVTVTQASAVWELAASDRSESERSESDRLGSDLGRTEKRTLFSGAMRIGRDHIASSVYTIAFATAGAGLSTLLLITIYRRPLAEVAQTEALSEEILRTLAGAVGLILAMPLTTIIGVAVVRASQRTAKQLEAVPDTSDRIEKTAKSILVASTVVKKPAAEKSKHQNVSAPRPAAIPPHKRNRTKSRSARKRKTSLSFDDLFGDDL